MTEDEISEPGQQERFARWEQIGVDRIKANLLSGGHALVRARDAPSRRAGGQQPVSEVARSPGRPSTHALKRPRAPA